MRTVTERETAAILAGLRLLQRALDSNPSVQWDGEQDILTNGGSHAGLEIEEINDLCEQVNCGTVVIK